MRKPRGAARPACSSSTRPSPPPTAGTRSRTRNTNTMFDIVRQNPAAEHTRRSRAGSSATLAAADLRRVGSRFRRRPRRRRKRRDFQPVAAQGDAERQRSGQDRDDHLAQCRRPPARQEISRRDRDLLGHWDHLGIGKPDANGDTHLQWRRRQRDRHRPADRAGARLRARAADRPLGRLPRRHGRGKGPARLANITRPTRSTRSARRSACSTPTRWACGARRKNFSISRHRQARPARRC